MNARLRSPPACDVRPPCRCAGSWGIEDGQHRLRRTALAGKEKKSGTFLLGVVYADNDSDKFYTPGEGISGVQVRIPNGAFYAVSSTSGGYTIPVTGLSGTIQVTISGGALS